MKVKSKSEVDQSCLTPRDPMDCSPPGYSVQGILQARVLEWIAALSMPANLENSAVATGQEKVSFHSNSQNGNAKEC